MSLDMAISIQRVADQWVSQSESIQNVVDRHLIRQASEKVFKEIMSIRTASLTKHAKRLREEFSVELFEAFASPLIGKMAAKSIGIKDIAKKVKDIWGAFKKAPKYWEEFKKMLGVKGNNLLTLAAELPKKVMAFFKQGVKAIASVAKTLTGKFGDFIKIFSAISSQTAIFNQIMERVMPILKNNPVTQGVVKGLNKAKDTAKNFLSKVKLGDGNGTLLDFFKGVLDWLLNSKVSNTLGIPLKAYVFFNIWINVTEISWDFTGIAKGMLGLISWNELFASLPESGVGFIISLFFSAAFPSITLFGPAAGSILTKISGNWLMFIAPVFQIMILAKDKLIQLTKGAIKFFWSKMGIDDWKSQGLPETIPLS